MIKNFFEKRFHIQARGSRISVEVVAGITVFFTAAYIIFLNPSILSSAFPSELRVSLTIATCIGAAVSCILCGFLANLPLIQASGLSLSALFVYTICGEYGYSWQAGLAAMLISGIIFIILTLTGVRERLLNAIPRDLKNAISIGIGLFICAIGLENSGISLYGAFGSFTSPMALMTIFGLLLIVVLTIIRFRYAIFVSLITVTLLVILIVYTNPNYASKLGVSNTFSFTFDYQIFGKFTEGFGHFFGKNGPTATQDLPAQITLFALLLLSIILVNIFDTIGALIGVIKHGNFFDQNGRALGVKKALLSDAIGTTLGGVFGYTPVTTFIESNVGVAAGARTGLAAVVTGIMFLIFIPLAPLTNLISPAATAPVMIVIGASMMRYVVDIDWKDPIAALPAFLTVVVMTVTKDIFSGIAIGFVIYTIIDLAARIAIHFGRCDPGWAARYQLDHREPLLYVFGLLFILYYSLRAGFGY